MSINLPLILMTPYGLLQGEIINLGLGGALIHLPKRVTSGNGFPVISVGKYYSLWIGLNNEGLCDKSGLVSVVAKVVWANTWSSEAEAKTRELRVCFMRPSANEAQNIIKTISQYI